MIDNHHIKRLRMIAYLGQRFIGTKREGKFSGRVAERERQGVRHAKLVVNAQDVQRLSHGDRILSSIARTGGRRRVGSWEIGDRSWEVGDRSWERGDPSDDR